MHRDNTGGAELYRLLLKKKIKLSALSDDEIFTLFSYMCGEIEQGKSVDKGLMHACAGAIKKPKGGCAVVTAAVYSRLGIRRSVCPRRRILQRVLIAALAVLTFLLCSFFTALALDVDIIESVKTVITPKRELQIRFEDHRAGANLPEAKSYGDLDTLFGRELSGYYYPAFTSESVKPYKVTVPAYGDVIYTISFKSANGEDWTVTAKDAEDKAMPMGFEYTDGGCKFVYTLSRKGNEIIKHDVYTTIDGVLYCFSLRTGNWDEVTGVIGSMTKAASE